MDTSTLLGLVIFGVIVAGAFWFVATYNRLVAAQQRVAQTWSNIDALLRQRHDELPKLVEICQPYVKYEQAAFDRLLEARQAVLGARHSVDATALGRAETELRGAVGAVLALATRHPELEAVQPFVALRQRIASLDTGILERRALYNQAVNDNNVAIEQFPGSVVANLGAFKPARPLEFESRAGGGAPQDR
jgi:LemA protein